MNNDALTAARRRVVEQCAHALSSVRSARPIASTGRAWRYLAARKALASVVAVLVLITVGGIAFASGAFDVRHVEIEGATKATSANIASVTRAVMGDPMLTVDTSRVRSRVAALPQVSSVHVARAWPDTLRVTVRERVPVVAVDQGSGWLLVDGTGAAYMTVSALPAHVLPLTMRGAVAKNPTVRAAVDVVTALPATVRATVTGVDAPSSAGISLHLKGGATVVWGGPDDSVHKAQALASLLRALNTSHRHPHVYDVSTPGFVTTS